MTGVPREAIEGSSLSPIAVDTPCGAKKTSGQNARNRREGRLGLLITLGLGILIFGSLSHITLKWQNRSFEAACDGCESKQFRNPFWQLQLMVGCSSLLYLVYKADMAHARWHSRRVGSLEYPTAADLQKIPSPVYLWAIVGFFDVMQASLMNIGYTILYVSTVEMLRNLQLLWTVLLQMFLLKRSLKLHEWLGISTLIVGMVSASLWAIEEPDASSAVNPREQWRGLVIVIIGTVFSGLQLITEEKILHSWYCHPYRGVGLLGIFGSIINLPLLLFAHYRGYYPLDTTLRQIEGSSSLMTSTILYIVSSISLSSLSLPLTFLTSGLFKGVVYSFRPPLLFIFEVTLGWQHFSGAYLFSMILSIIGFGLYANILPVPNGTRLVLRQPLRCYCTIDEEGSEQQEEDMKRKAPPVDTPFTQSPTTGEIEMAGEV